MKKNIILEQNIILNKNLKSLMKLIIIIIIIKKVKIV